MIGRKVCSHLSNVTEIIQHRNKNILKVRLSGTCGVGDQIF